MSIEVVCLQLCLVVTSLVLRGTAASSAHVLSRCIIQPCTNLHCHLIRSVTCHLPLWQNGRDLIHATAVTPGRNGYRPKSQHRELTIEKKILPTLSPAGTQTGDLSIRGPTLCH